MEFFMKKFALLGVAAAALIAAPTFAQQARGGFERGAGITRAQAEAQVRTGFARVDANRDGFVTQAEAQQVRGAVRGQRGERREARFAQLDANRDGSISRAEFFAKRDRGDRAERRAARQERRAERFERRQGCAGMIGRIGNGRMFERLDQNRDGRVSLAEATNARLRAFDRVDQNRDGRITREERQAVKAARQSRRG